MEPIWPVKVMTIEQIREKYPDKAEPGSSLKFAERVQFPYVETLLDEIRERRLLVAKPTPDPTTLDLALALVEAAQWKSYDDDTTVCPWCGWNEAGKLHAALCPAAALMGWPRMEK